MPAAMAAMCKLYYRVFYELEQVGTPTRREKHVYNRTQPATG